MEQAIPIRDVCEDGIFLVGRNLWSKTYRFTDVNYATASEEDKEGKNLLKWRSRQKKFKVKVQQPKQLPAPKRPALPPAKTTAKTAQKSVKTAQQSAKATAKTAKVTVKAGQRAVQAAKAAAKVAVRFAKVAAKAIVAAVKAAAAAVKGIVAAIAAGGWIAVVVILLICMIGLVVGSVFGIFTPNPDKENGITIVQTVREANEEYEAQISEIKSRYDYDKILQQKRVLCWNRGISSNKNGRKRSREKI